MMNIKSYSVDSTEKLGEKFASKLKGNEVIAMYGDLGAGKTAFTRGIARGLGIYQGVSSPTFAIVNEYHGKFTVYHFDMYRIENWDDLYSIGFFDYIDTGILIIEWSENIEAALPDDTIKVSITKGTEENERIIKIDGIDSL